MMRTLLAFLAVTASLLIVPAAARADRWDTMSAGFTAAFEPGSPNACAAGRTACVDAVIGEMDQRHVPLRRSCDHDAVFSLVYLRTTEAYRQAIENPAFFQDTPFVNHEDAVFARMYFDAFDAWHGGRTWATPSAWAIAFEAADQRSVTGAGNLLLGINAHVQRDLPFALYDIGMVKRDGTSRKPDHDKVNEILERVYPGLIAELARDYDPTIDDSDLPTDVDNRGLFQIVRSWREIAWRNAERLALALTPVDRRLVAQSIESYAASQAELIRQASAYLPGQTSAARDAYCAQRRAIAR